MIIGIPATLFPSQHVLGDISVGPAYCCQWREAQGVPGSQLIWQPFWLLGVVSGVLQWEAIWGGQLPASLEVPADVTLSSLGGISLEEVLVEQLMWVVLS